LRLTPTEAIRKLSFVDKPEEAQKNSEKALEFLKNSPYKDKLANVGLFHSQLQSQRSALKQLINARLGNQVYFTSELLQVAPDLQPANVQQLGALPMGSRVKINAWNEHRLDQDATDAAHLTARENSLRGDARQLALDPLR